MNDPVPGRFLALVGFMGAGKTAVGRILAARWGRRFLDLDESILARTGRPAAGWIREEGEEAFRRQEEAILEEILAEAAGCRPRPLLACGGGTFCREGTRRRLLEGALCLWLDVPLEEALGRAPGDRPLLEGGPEAVRRLYEERRPLYAQAHIRVPAGSRGPEEVAEEVERLLSPWRRHVDGAPRNPSESP